MSPTTSLRPCGLPPPHTVASCGVTSVVERVGATLCVLLGAVGAGCAGVIHAFRRAVDVGAQAAIWGTTGVDWLCGEAVAGVAEVLMAAHPDVEFVLGVR